MNIIYLNALVLILACWLLPNHTAPWPAMYSEFCFAAGVSIIGVLVFMRPLRQKIEWPWFAVLVLGVSFIPMIQAGFGLIRLNSVGVLSALYLLGFALSIVIGRQLIKRFYSEHWMALLLVFLYASIFSVGLELCQVLHLGGNAFIIDSPNSRGYANLGQPNQLATLLFWGVLVAIFFWVRQKISFATLVLVLSFLAIGIVLTQSRSGVLMCTALMMSFLFSRRIFSNVLSVFLICWAVFIMLGVIFVNDLFLVEIPLAAVNERLTGGTRPYHWRVLIDALLQAPYFGYGWGQVANAHVSVALNHPATHEWQEHGHNIVLDLLLWNGIPLGMALIAFGVFWFWQQLRHCVSVEGFLLRLAVFGLLIHALLEYPLEYSYFLFPAGLMIGALAGVSKEKKLFKVSRRLTVALVSTCIFLLLLIYHDYRELEENYKELRFQAARIGGGDVTSGVPDVLVLNQLRDLLMVGRERMTPSMAQQDLQLVRDVSSRYPLPPILMQDALAHGLNGDPLRAGNVLQVLCKRHGRGACAAALREWTESVTEYPALSGVPLPQDRGI